MSDFKGPYRRIDFKEPNDGAYVTVYQRPGEEVALDVVFFDGDQSIGRALLRQRLLDKAIEKAKEWSKG
jgi:hypothetical protein